jgi:hypothetical protein
MPKSKEVATSHADPREYEMPSVAEGEYDPNWEDYAPSSEEGYDTGAQRLPPEPCPDGYNVLFIALEKNSNLQGGEAVGPAKTKAGKLPSINAIVVPRLVVGYDDRDKPVLGPFLDRDYVNSSNTDFGGGKFSNRLAELMRFVGHPYSSTLKQGEIAKHVRLAFAEQEAGGFLVGAITQARVAWKVVDAHGVEGYPEIKGRDLITAEAKRQARAKRVEFNPAKWYILEGPDGSEVVARARVVRYVALRD